MGRGLFNLENVAAYRPPSEIFSGTFHSSCSGSRRHRSRFHYRRRELSSRENSAIPRCRACFNLHDLRLSRVYMRIVQIRNDAIITKRDLFKKTIEDTRRNLCRREKFCVKNMFWRINKDESVIIFDILIS